MGVLLVGSGQVSGAVAHLSKHRLGMRRGNAITDRPAGTVNPQACRWTRPDDRSSGRHRGRSAHLISALTWLWTVIFLVSYIEADWSGRICTAKTIQWHNLGYQCLVAETSAPAAPCHLDTPLSFVSRRPSTHINWYVGDGCGEANKRSTDSKHEATLIPFTIGLFSGGRYSQFSEVEKILSQDLEKRSRLGLSLSSTVAIIFLMPKFSSTMLSTWSPYLIRLSCCTKQ